MTSMNESKPNFEVYPSEVRGTVKGLYETLGTTIQALTAIMKDIEKGAYTRQAAAEDFENLVHNEGIDVFSTLDELAESESSTW